MTIVKRRLWPVRYVFAVLVVTAAVVMAQAIPASAVGTGDCTSGNVCLYKDAGYGGGIKLFAGNETSYSGNFLWWVIDCAFTNNTSSAYNKGTSGQSVRLYANSSHTGASYSIGQYVQIQNFVNIGFNDVASSHKWH